MIFTRKSRKAQGLSMTTIVVAALALLVLIILSVIFVGRIGKTQEAAVDCVKRGGTCYDASGTCKDYGDFLITHPDAQCLTDGPNGNKVTDDTQICCVNAGG